MSNELFGGSNTPTTPSGVPKTNLVHDLLKAQAPHRFTTSDIAGATGLTVKAVQNALRQLGGHKRLAGIKNVAYGLWAYEPDGADATEPAWATPMQAAKEAAVPFIGMSWENDIPDALGVFFDALVGRNLTVNGADVNLVEMQGWDLVVQTINDEGERVGSAYTITNEDVRTLVLY